MKKTIGTMIAGGLLLASFTPIFARGYHRSTPDLNANVNLAKVRVTTTSSANSGENSAGEFVSVKMASVDDIKMYHSTNKVYTGDAYSDAHATTFVNKGVASCSTCADLNVNLNAAKVRVYSNADANSGRNTAGNTVIIEKAHVDDITLGGYNKIDTGKADADSSSFVVVNATYSH